MSGASQGLVPQLPQNSQPLQSTWTHSSPYHLFVKQQPERAKAANAKDKDRKPVDPPVILQLEVDPGEDPLQLYITSPYLFVQTFLIGASESDPEPDLNSLTGNTCTSGHVVKDDRGVHNMMFCLNDISIKKEGTYRLRFCLFKLNTGTGEVENLTSISSQPFTTYSGRHFPGMSESTSMTRLLVDAGVRLRLRKESKGMNSKKKNSTFGQMTSRRSQGEEEEDRPLKRVRSEPSGKHSMALYTKHGSLSTPQSYTGHSTPSTTLSQYQGAFHPVTSPSTQSMASIGSMSSAYVSGLQLGLDTSVGHYHSPPSAGSSYQSPGRQSPSTVYPIHGTTASSQGLLTATSPLAQYNNHPNPSAQGSILPPVDNKMVVSHGSAPHDLNYTTAASYSGNYLPLSSSRTLPGVQRPQRSSSIVGLGNMQMRVDQAGLSHAHAAYGEGSIFEPYTYGSRDGH